MLLRLEIGQQLAGLSGSRPGFLRSGDMIADLNDEGKVPWLKEIFARVEISSEKTELHDLIRDVGI